MPQPLAPKGNLPMMALLALLAALLLDVPGQTPAQHCCGGSVATAFRGYSMIFAHHCLLKTDRINTVVSIKMTRNKSVATPNSQVATALSGEKVSAST